MSEDAEAVGDRLGAGPMLTAPGMERDVANGNVRGRGGGLVGGDGGAAC